MAGSVVAAAQRIGQGKAQPAQSLVAYHPQLAPAMQYVFGNAFVCRVPLPLCLTLLSGMLHKQHICWMVPWSDCWLGPGLGTLHRLSLCASCSALVSYACVPLMPWVGHMQSHVLCTLPATSTQLPSSGLFNG